VEELGQPDRIDFWLDDDPAVGTEGSVATLFRCSGGSNVGLAALVCVVSATLLHSNSIELASACAAL